MSEKQVPIIVSGALGRMGKAIQEALEIFPEIDVVGFLESPEKLAGRTTLPLAGREIPSASHLEKLSVPAGTIVIDFSHPSVTVELARHAAALNVKLVVGTTGLSDSDLAELHEASRTTAVLVSGNMSVGIQALLAIIEELAQSLKDFDIEIIEMHHRHKKDAPSGTALMLAEAAAKARHQDLRSVARHGRKGMLGERPAEEIGLHAVRGGDIVGEHIVVLAGEGEHLEFRHSAHSRRTFAMGALRAALYLSQQPRGFFTMRDVVKRTYSAESNV